MGASIENNHLLAALLDKIQQSNKVHLVNKKVIEIRAARNEWERPMVTLEDGTQI